MRKTPEERARMLMAHFMRHHNRLKALIKKHNPCKWEDGKCHIMRNPEKFIFWDGNHCCSPDAGCGGKDRCRFANNGKPCNAVSLLCDMSFPCCMSARRDGEGGIMRGSYVEDGDMHDCTEEKLHPDIVKARNEATRFLRGLTNDRYESASTNDSYLWRTRRHLISYFTEKELYYVLLRFEKARDKEEGRHIVYMHSRCCTHCGTRMSFLSLEGNDIKCPKCGRVRKWKCPKIEVDVAARKLKTYRGKANPA